eukprot:205766-Alexandrium_andersonii.AAC.1
MCIRDRRLRGHSSHCAGVARTRGRGRQWPSRHRGGGSGLGAVSKVVRRLPKRGAHEAEDAVVETKDA